MSGEAEPDLTEYEKAPSVKQGAECEWCDEEGDDEQGPIRDYGRKGQMHAGCAWSSEHGGLATAVRDLDPAEVAELEQRMNDNDGEGIEPWWRNP